jgi:hypothetical protein
MSTHPTFRLALAVAVLCVEGISQAQTVTVVNMIPNTSSGETNHDSEPNLAVNPSNPLQLAATAFTPDPMGTAGVAPIYLSSDGGNTWSLNSILTIPTMNQCVGNSTCDITPRFAQTSGNLYLSWLTADAALNIPLIVARSQPFPGPAGTPTNLQTINTSYPNVIDQPFTQASTALSGANSGDDRVYIGANDLRGGTSGHTASLDASQAAEGTPPAGFSALQGIETRSTCNQDGPPVRPAVHPTGIVYAAFYRWTGSSCFGALTADVVVVRDDSWGTGSPPYQALKDTDTLAGKIVASQISLPSCNSTVGNQRVCGSLSIAVDPNDNQTVWLVYATGTGATDYTLHVRRSSNGGATWGSDLKTVSPAVNAALAITTDSKVGFLYQKLVSPGTCTGGTPCWETHLEITTHGTAWTNVTLANTPDTLTSSINNILGDYEYLAAVGKNFYGIFSANDLPNSSNFPQGVTYQRYADLTSAHQLYADAGHTMTVAASIDPFFFSAVNVPAAEDYYVRDWTDSPTSHDNGEEPSTNPVWWTTSDVWNRLTNTAGVFNANDQPAHQVAQDATSGHNYAFVRIHRKAAAPTGSAAEQVSASFMFADYGLGVPYQYVTGAPLSSTASLTFVAGDTEHTLADGAGVQWDLPAERSTHVCMAVEIAGPQDPYSPELLGRAPGWPTDLLITTDNNKAQINMDLPPVVQGGGQWQSFGIAHNAALFKRDMTIRYQVAPGVLRKLAGRSFIVASGGGRIPMRTSGVFKLTNMNPGETRWIGVVIEATAGARTGETLPVTFEEMAGPNALNGFTIATRVSDVAEVIRHNLGLHRATFRRLAAAFELEEGERQSAAAGKLLKETTISEQDYLKFLMANEAGMRRALAELTGKTKGASEFQLEASLAAMAKAAGAGQSAAAANAHGTLLNELDFGQTIAQKSQGDPDDFLQMVEWQQSLYSSSAALRRTEGAGAILEESRGFVAAVTHQKAGVGDYPALLERLVASFRGTAESLEKSDPGLKGAVKSLEEQLESKNLRKIEGRHRQLLTSLANIANGNPN